MTPSSYWLPATVLSFFCFGLWGFFCKLAIQHINAKSALFYQSVGFAVVGVFILLLLQLKPDVQSRGVIYGLLAGMSTGIGCLFFFIAADKGKVTTVVTVTALYPLFTIFLAYALLHEAINLKQGFGIAMALVAIQLLS